MNQVTADCASFFHERPAYRRILELLLRKYRSYGRPAGTICLPDATPEECDAVRGLFGRSFSPPLLIKTADFEAALQGTPYRGAVLKDVLECYFDTTIQTKREVRDQIDACILRVTDEATAAVQSRLCRRWLDELSHRCGEGYRLIRKALPEDGDAVRRAVLQACKSIDWLERHPDERIRLAVLSAYATSDPHALDTNTLGGKLFLHLLSMQAGVELPAGAEERAALYYYCGILCDSISSLVTQVGVRLYTDAEEHPAYRAFRLRNEAAHFHSPLICTSGQLTIAVIRLLDLLVSSGTELFYSGDFDGKGLSIAQQLLARYSDRLHLWHMTAADYAQCRSEVRLSEKSRALLRNCAGTVLAPAAEAVGHSGCDGYQELLLSQLQADLMET